MRIGSKTDKGRIREQNEDSFGYRDNLFVVADGMGGHEAGEIASGIAVETILKTDLSRDIPLAIQQAVVRANEAILQETDLQPAYQGMGTTVTILVLDGEQAYLAHVGDSRIYRLSGGTGQLEQLTEDHSLVAELVKNGGLTAEEAQTHPQRNILTRALGTKGLPEVEVRLIPAGRGDKFLLCSDGLSGMVRENELQQFLSLAESPQEIVERLIDAANQQGGNDNITAILIEI
ncbi:protein phosphatase [Hydrogenispora ethanolica]|uniref:Protein phosphatase n=1 Tax=Hydrogenispora ethanolica TaxID=1082276 RepID=A0A4R1R8V4_HYDET|nr:Stp1/IreP family PP2C-type Ser/Thr phosphatase [Hydrogenispora ethanolica]TCL62101.1 protein phosphatase [Hydrogenispora ethanolica]